MSESSALEVLMARLSIKRRAGSARGTDELSRLLRSWVQLLWFWVQDPVFPAAGPMQTRPRSAAAPTGHIEGAWGRNSPGNQEKAREPSSMATGPSGAWRLVAPIRGAVGRRQVNGYLGCGSAAVARQRL